MHHPLRFFLMIRRSTGDWSVSVSQKLDEPINDWHLAWGGGSVEGVAHVGFGRPAPREFDDLADSNPGRMLITEAAKYVLPAPTVCSANSIGQAGGIPVFLALEGWGYTIEDSTTKDISSRTGGASVGNEGHPFNRLKDWTAKLPAIAPDFVDIICEAGIFDEESYLRLEGCLPDQVRTALGRVRFDVLIQDSSDPSDFVRCAPPWLRAQEITNLPLTVRLTNVFNRNRITYVADLDNYTEAQLLRMQNFGKSSKKHLCEALEEGFQRGSAHSGLTDASYRNGLRISNRANADDGETASIITVGLIGNLLRTLNSLEERVRYILMNRMGFDNAPKTLEQIGGQIGVTRERVRQIEKKWIERIIAGELWDDALRHRINAILDDREEPLPLYGLEVVDEWFRGTADKQSVIEYLIDWMCEKRINVIKVRGVRYVTRIDQDLWQEKLSEARNFLQSIVDLNWPETECRQNVESFMPIRSKEIAPLLWSEASRLCLFSASGDDRIFTAYGHGLEQLIQVVLEDSPTALHTSEVAERVGDLAGRQVDEAQIRNPLANVGFLLGRGSYGLRKHIPASETELKLLSDFCEETIGEDGPGRQWHASELFAEALEREPALCQNFDKYVLNVALHLKSQLKYLGRLVWGASDAECSDRVDIGNAVIDLLDTAGRPLTSREINEQLSQIRGLNGQIQIWNRDPVIRVGRGLWGLNDRDVSVKREQQPELVEQLYIALQSKGSGIHLEEVTSFLDGALNMAPDAIFSIATSDERIGFSIGRFAYLKEWGEPRRVSLWAALEKMSNQIPGPIEASEIKSWLEFITERDLDQRSVSHALSSVGMPYLGDGIWDIQPQDTNEDSTS